MLPELPFPTRSSLCASSVDATSSVAIAPPPSPPAVNLTRPYPTGNLTLTTLVIVITRMILMTSMRPSESLWASMTQT
jgi:hypothetical protein